MDGCQWPAGCSCRDHEVGGRIAGRLRRERGQARKAAGPDHLKPNDQEMHNMKRIRQLSLALIAVFALSALAASSAMAESPTILPTPTPTAPAKFTEATTGSWSLESSGGTKLACEHATAKGEFTGERTGNATIDYEGCFGGGIKCNSPGDAAGVILTAGSAELVDVLPTGALDLGIWIEAHEASSTKDLTLKCGIIAATMLGASIGVFDNAKGDLLKDLEKGKEFKVLSKQSTTGEQEIKTCDLTKSFCEGKTFEVKSSFGFGEELSTEVTDAVVNFEKEVEFHF
jgi:hypothetical protein